MKVPWLPPVVPSLTNRTVPLIGKTVKILSYGYVLFVSSPTYFWNVFPNCRGCFCHRGAFDPSIIVFDYLYAFSDRAPNFGARGNFSYSFDVC